MQCWCFCTKYKTDIVALGSAVLLMVLNRGSGGRANKLIYADISVIISLVSSLRWKYMLSRLVCNLEVTLCSKFFHGYALWLWFELSLQNHALIQVRACLERMEIKGEESREEDVRYMLKFSTFQSPFPFPPSPFV